MAQKGIYKRKDGRFEARLCLGKDKHGKRVSRSFYGKTTNEALQKLCNYKRIIVLGESAEMTVSELCYEWLGVVRNRIKPSTYANYQMKLEKHIIPAFARTLGHKLNRQQIYAFITEKLQGGLTARYVSDIVVLLKAVLKYANREHHIPYVLDDIVMPKCQPPQVKLLDSDQQQLLTDYITNHSDSTGLGVLLSLMLGLRLGEVCGLQWKDIDTEKRVLYVRKTVQRVGIVSETSKTKVIVMPPKSKSSVREIPLPVQLLELLKMRQQEQERYVLNGKLQPIEPRTMQYRFATMLEKANLPSVSFHSLRHAFATNAIELGFDVKTLSELLGHSKVEITLNRYVHSSMERKRAFMELVKYTA